MARQMNPRDAVSTRFSATSAFVGWLVLAFAALLAIFPASARAQVLGGVVGTITDPTGAVVPGAKVTATESETGVVARTVVSNEQGYYAIPDLRPTSYTLTVEARGFKTLIQKGIVLQANQSGTANLTLELGSQVQQVTVSSIALQVNTTTQTVGEVINSTQVVELPLNGRNAASLLLLTPGSMTVPTPSAYYTNSINQTAAFPTTLAIGTNGNYASFTAYYLDGATNLDQYSNGNMPYPNPDALQEFSVQTNNYQPKFGEDSGALVNIVTKSGTNALHGDVFEFLRNPHFNARTFFAATHDLLHQNQFGGTLGGPVVIPGAYDGRNRSFFFFSYQGTRTRDVTNGNVGFVPTASDLNGDFSAELTASNPNNPLHSAVQITNNAGVPFVGNQIPTSLFDKASLNLTTYFPAPTLGNGEVFYAKPSATGYNEYLGRFDQSFGSNDRLTVRYFGDFFDQAPQFQPTNILVYTTGEQFGGTNALLHETHTFSPTLVNEAYFNFTRRHSYRYGYPGAPTPNSLGSAVYQPSVKIIQAINAPGYFDPSGGCGGYTVYNDLNGTDDLSWVRGRHTLGFGFNVERSRIDLEDTCSAGGSYTFNALPTGFMLSSFLLGYLDGFTQGIGDRIMNRNTFMGFYAQDTFHVARRLTLNFGLRYEPTMAWNAVNHHMSNFDPVAWASGVVSTVYVNAPPGEFFPGEHGVTDRGIKGEYTNFAPRVGFAYDVFGDGKTSLRGGAGIFDNARINGIFNNRFTSEDPFDQTVSTTLQGTFSNPYLGITNPFPASLVPSPNFSFLPYPVLAVAFTPGSTFKVPIDYQWNLTLERQLTPTWLVRVAYLGSETNHIEDDLQYNAAIYTPGSTLSTTARRPFQPYGSLSVPDFGVNANYNALQVGADKRVSHGVTLSANYVWSQSLDDEPNENVPEYALGGNSGYSTLPWNNPGRHRMDYGDATMNRPNHFALSYVWVTPALSGANRWERGFLRTWELTGILTGYTGDPVTVIAGTDRSQTGLGGDHVVQSGPTYGLGACGSSAPCVNWLVPGSFSLPAIGTFGMLGKNTTKGPGQWDWDMGLSKNVPLREQLKLQFRAEFFNSLNRANLGDPITTFTSGGFGSITSANASRVGQFSLKLLF
jgi:hypothetical protein